ncbi:ATP-binding protein [Candidatus Parcubacteria bacterium]|nr:ATP-binding protein [Candidatus Parcubacteria bacterium]
MKKIVITGGPCGGKSTVLAVLKEKFAGAALVVPEGATMLLNGGFPVPGCDLPWSPEWQETFQAALVGLQRSLERAWELTALANGAWLLLCDRGVLDGAAYTPGGLAEFSRRYGVNPAAEYERYAAVIHLESLATGQPELYGKAGNDIRFESVEEAANREYGLREAWRARPRWYFLGCQQGIEGKIRRAVEIVSDIAGPGAN